MLLKFGLRTNERFCVHDFRFIDMFSWTKVEIISYILLCQRKRNFTVELITQLCTFNGDVWCDNDLLIDCFLHDSYSMDHYTNYLKRMGWGWILHKIFFFRNFNNVSLLCYKEFRHVKISIAKSYILKFRS